MQFCRFKVMLYMKRVWVNHLRSVICMDRVWINHFNFFDEDTCRRDRAMVNNPGFGTHMRV